MNIQKLSIIIPAYNEAATIRQVLETISELELISSILKEILVIDDGSCDETATQIQSFMQQYTGSNMRLIQHKHNLGKGAAIKTGIKEATGDCIIIQDADLEYDPEEINILLEPVIKGKADVVYGSRFQGGRAHRVLFYWHSVGNKFLTFLSNMFTDLNLTDMESGYKLFRREIMHQITLRENGFGFEPEVTAKMARVPGIRVYEVGISYYGRTYEQGKKINWRDGFWAIWCIIKYGLFKKW